MESIMRSVLSLFAKSPFKGLSAHMEKGRECYKLLKPLFEAAFAEDYDKVDEIFRQIHEMEHEADILKDDIRSALPKSLFLPVDRRDLLNVLTAQDSVPDTVEDIAMLVRIRQTKYPEWLQSHVMALLEAALAVCDSTVRIVAELDLLLEVSFGGPEAERVMEMIQENGYLEHAADKVGFRVARSLYEHEAELSAVDIMMLNDIFRALGTLANAAESVAKHYRLFVAKA